MNNKVAIVTGITGQDGAYLSKYLIENDYKVFGLIRDTTKPNISNLEYLCIKDGLELVKSNLIDLSNLLRVIDKIKPDEIYHLAAQSSVGLSFNQPIWTLEFNLLSTANILEAVRIAKPDTRFYHASSSEMYGNIEKEELPIKEDTRVHPSSPYGISKASSHWLAINYRESYNLFVSCGILFNHESALRGNEFVTKKIIETAFNISKGKADQLIIGNININRDWGYAPEYVKSMWKILQQEKADDFIICSGEAHSLEEFVMKVFKFFDLDYKKYVKVDESLFRPNELNIIYGDNTKAKEILGWDYDMDFNDLINALVKDHIEYHNFNSVRKI